MTLFIYTVSKGQRIYLICHSVKPLKTTVKIHH